MQGTNFRNADDAPSVDYWQVVKNRYGVITLTFLLVFMTAALNVVKLDVRDEDRGTLELE